MTTTEGEYNRQHADPESWEETPLDAPEGYWITSWADGERRVPIREMTDDHLRNAVAYEERAGNVVHSKVDELRAELRRRGTFT